MNRIPDGYELIEHPRCVLYYWREIRPIPLDLIDALSVLPENILIEVMTGPEQVGEAKSVTYWPTENRAVIG